MHPSSKIALFVTILFLSQTCPILACINAPESPVKVGQPIYTEKLGPGEYIQKLLAGHLAAQDWEFALANAKNPNLRESNSVDENSVAVALIHLGRTHEALKILEKLERRSPGSYYVAANLGTAYELLGDNEKAYKWIAEGMKRNPDSHFGTEWLHLKILKAKQAIKKEPQWIDKNSVLGIDWEMISGDLSKVRVSDNRKTVHNADAVRKAIEYQLHERTEFVKPPDPTVASLLYDLSHLVRHSRSEEHGNLVLNAAHTYGHLNTLTSSPVIAAPETETIATETSYWVPAIIVTSILAAFLFGGLWLRSRTTS
ncbi:MAG: tetratricopeptide repeat protein [Acidobacteria bacterium]|nr:tetratricopeptide repeat protein [Acidobacteriota bacterium]